MMSKSDNPPTNDSGFDNIALVYDFLAFCVFGFSQRKVERYFLNSIPLGSKIFIIGGGSGDMLKKVIQSRRPRHITYLEASEKMLAKAQARIAGIPAKVDFILGNNSMISKDESFDVIITSFFLDLFNEQRAKSLINELYNHLEQKGLWLQTDFVEDRIHNNLFKLVLIKGMYVFFKWICKIEAKNLPQLETHFKLSNLIELENRYFYHNMIRASIYQKE